MLFGHRRTPSLRKDIALLVLRTGVGGVLVAHGTQKLFGWFGGSGLEGTGQAMEQMGYEPGRPNALMAGLGEAGGGVLLASGLATPLGAAAAAGVMGSAIPVHAPAGFFNSEGGFEYPAVMGTVALAIGVAGSGRLSLDHLLGHRLDRPWMTAVGAALGAAAAAGVVLRRASTVAARKAEAERERE